ncbi:hypothetical protein PHYBLDRAFT_138388 [Phycomyces blakesleeanus NRRL 1555(-)]|uniref:Uncharacterized protein n=1 Tax=Phycomyces blakesleeanus (strain ATCC 8743b / DSM 1359 / FGSC 10004 / NBRC 33097 / NRRL 1555) TaxID=763407 RepID=A0A167R4P4_PHYB8|nr:hypothetical protein PHYBLDRAFT_138388 [Phycomyces blakesleeanus NRRL 1555(-)]OAD80837.1 hypothetical protein PHYBLDRAFT_138388 [Phycomyces blakesleeanus NRRL 1555(-)]|eukprot:XP_018298877.1 hypothetical protein PHYBLDRAFT_138388 [Phycomyces blakesleeanus NRRL 1555(-)]
MPSNSSRKTDHKGKEKASASISTSANHVLAGRVAPVVIQTLRSPRKISPSFSSATIQDQRYAEIVEMFNKVSNSINGVKDDIAAVNSNMTAFKNRMGVVVDMSGKTHTAFADFATAYANDQTRMASLEPSLMPFYVPQTSLSDAKVSVIISFESDDPALVAENESKKKWNLNKINHCNSIAVINYLKSYISAQTCLAGTHPPTGNPVEKAYLKLFQKDAMSDGESDIEIFNRLLTMVDNIDCIHHVSNAGVGTKPRMNRYPATLLPCSVPATLSQSLPRWAINDE